MSWAEWCRGTQARVITPEAAGDLIGRPTSTQTRMQLGQQRRARLWSRGQAVRVPMLSGYSRPILETKLQVVHSLQSLSPPLSPNVLTLH